MTITRFEPGDRMSMAVVHGDTIYLAGQVGTEGADIAEQTRTALAKVDRILGELGSNKSRILNVTIWLADMADFAAMNEVYDAWIDPENPPARACGESRLATPGYTFEVMVVAATGD